MPAPRSAPPALRLVMWLSLLYGIGAAVGIVAAWRAGVVNVDLGVLGIPTFFGLRRFSSGWRTVALVGTWITLAAWLLLLVVGLRIGSSVTAQVFGFRVSGLSTVPLSVLCVAGFGVAVWQYRVLTRPDVRALFRAHVGPAPAARA